MWGSFFFTIKTKIQIQRFHCKTQLNGYGLLVLWHPWDSKWWDKSPAGLFTDRWEWGKSLDFCCLLRLSIGIKTLVLSMACRAKHQWNLTHSTFSNKAEREDVVVTTDGEAEFYDEHRSSRKEVLWRKVEACFIVFGSAWEEETHPLLLPFLFPQKNPE